MTNVLCHPDDLRSFTKSSGWHNVFELISHPDELAIARISTGWFMDTVVCHPDDISFHHMSPGWLSSNWYLIRMCYDNVILSSGWHTLPFLSHPDEIANFDFPQHVVALQRFRNNVTDPVPISSSYWTHLEQHELYWVWCHYVHCVMSLCSLYRFPCHLEGIFHDTAVSPIAWSRHQMKTFAALLALCVALCVTGHRWIPHTKASDA